MRLQIQDHKGNIIEEDNFTLKDVYILLLKAKTEEASKVLFSYDYIKHVTEKIKDPTPGACVLLPPDVTAKIIRKEE